MSENGISSLPGSHMQGLSPGEAPGATTDDETRAHVPAPPELPTAVSGCGHNLFTGSVPSHPQAASVSHHVRPAKLFCVPRRHSSLTAKVVTPIDTD